MDNITWLHISDWHQGAEKYQKTTGFDRSVVREKMFEDIQKRQTFLGTDQVDFIIFSGDIAFSGQSEEFESAKREFLDPLLKKCGLLQDRLFVIPGNHDINQNDIEFCPGELQKPATSEEQVKKWLADPKWLSKVIEPFSAFENFVKDYTQQDNPAYATSRTWEIGNHKVALAGLNSAWMCGRNKNANGETNDDGFVFVGEPQVRKAIEDTKDADIKIAVLHHPFDWLNRFERTKIEELLEGNFHFILRGHEHDPKVKEIAGTAGRCILIPAGATYDRRVAADPRYFNSYNFVRLNMENGQSAVYLRRWSEKREKWIEDTDTHSSGKYPFTFKTPHTAPTPQSLLSSESIQTTPLSPLEGWDLITKEFLESQKSTLRPAELKKFFDGQIPTWRHALSNAIPQRDIVKKVVDELLPADFPTLIQLFGPVGEGKSLALLHVAISLVDKGWNVLFREDEGKLISTQVLNLAKDGQWALLSENADQIHHDISECLEDLNADGRENIHWVMVARDTAWKRLEQHNTWHKLIKIWPYDSNEEIFKMSKEEAAKVIHAWDNANCLGELASLPTTDERIRKLWDVPRTNPGASSNRTFFGAILAARFGARGLRDYVKTLMEALEKIKIISSSNQNTLYDAFIYAAAMDAAGIEGVDLYAVADLLGVKREDRLAELRYPLGHEAAGTSSSSALCTRHPMIGRAAILLAEDNFDENLEEVYKDIIWATYEIKDNSEIVVANYGEIMSCGTILSTRLNEIGISKDRANEIAVAAAKQSAHVGSKYLSNTTNLAKTYRTIGQPEKAREILRSAMNDATDCLDWKTRGRAYVYELAIAEGHASSFHNICLAGIAAADFNIFGALTDEDAKMTLSGIGLVSGRIEPINKDSVYAKAIRAVAVLGLQAFKSNQAFETDTKALQYFTFHQTEADRLNVEMCNIETAYLWIKDVVQDAFKHIQDASLLNFLKQLGVASPNSITFQKLKNLLEKYYR